MRCTRIRKYLIPYAEGALPERLSGTVEGHVAKCASCARELRELAGVVDVLRSTDYPALEPASDIRSRIMAQLANEPMRRSWWSGRLQAYSAAAAALVFFTVLVFAFEPALFRSVEPRPDVTQRSSGQLEVARKTALSPPPTNISVPEKSRLIRQKSAGSIAHSSEIGTKPTTARDRRDQKSVIPSVRQDAYSFDKDSHQVAASPASGAPSFGMSANDQKNSATQAPPRWPQPTNSPTADESNAAAKVAARSSEKLESVDNRSVGWPGPRDADELHPAFGNTQPTTELAAEPRVTRGGDEETLLLEKSLREYPTSRTALLGLMEAYKKSGRAEDEYAIAERLTKLDGSNAQYWFMRGQAAERAKKLDSAAAAYRRAIGLKLAGSELQLAESRLKELEAAEKH
jgi:hypothetical protein